MKVSANSFLLAPAAPSNGQAKGGLDYGQGFESAIRSAQRDGADSAPLAKGSSGAEEPQGTAANKDAEVESTKSREAEHAKSRGRSKGDGGEHKVKAAEGRAPKEPKATGKSDDATEAAESDDAKAGVDAASSSADELLARLLGGATAVAVPVEAGAAAAPKGDPVDALDALAAQTVLEERIVVISLEAGAKEPVSDAADGARSSVKLEVVHMETHFEPRSDAFVLVEKKGGEAVASGSAAAALDAKGTSKTSSNQEAGAPKLSFDETLAQLAQRKSDVSGQGEGGRGESRDDKAAQRAARKEANGVDARGAVQAAAAKDDDGAGHPLASMTNQVAARVIDALGPTLTSQRSADLSPQSETYLKMTAGGAALKTLSIQLQPEHLGRLDVSMRLIEGQLTLEIAATEASTAKVLAEDRDGLRKLLQHAGFSLDDTAITIVARDATAHGRVAAANDSSAAQQDGTTSRNTGGGSQDRDSRSPQRDGGRDEGRRQPAADLPRRASRSSATFV